MVFRTIFFLILITICSVIYAQEYPKNTFTTQRLNSSVPVIDGKLDDACWNEGEWFTDFIQCMPREGQKPSQPTELKILYDDKYLYVAFRALDSEPDKIDIRTGRKDSFNGDQIGVALDTYFDHVTGAFEFDISAAGTKTDLVLFNGQQWDTNWDAVWDGKVGLEDSAWTAEFRIPFSQLRYTNTEEPVWGMHVWRWINRLQEEDQFSLVRMNGPGHLFDMGYLKGLKNIPQNRQIELMPYVLGKLKRDPVAEENPFSKKNEWSGNVGLDGKIGLSTNLTMDLTINPDFGQVEADPANLNLSVYEVFYNEKRPFFLEGRETIFNFDFDEDLLFYSRRIGHPPAIEPDLKSNEYAKIPDATAILGAVKLSGRTKSGLSIGILESLTGKETAEIDNNGNRSEQTVEPLSNYFVARLKQDMNESNTSLGGIITMTNRKINEKNLYILPENVFTGGLDFKHYLMNKTYFIEAKFIGSHLNGESPALIKLQQTSSRYYHRPGIDYVNYNEDATVLNGHGGSLEFNKESYGNWRYNTKVVWKSPGLELNDLGFLQTADEVKTEAGLTYIERNPQGIFRTYSISLNGSDRWNFGGDNLYSDMELNASCTFLNLWSISAELERTSEIFDTRILRGGPAIYTKGFWEVGAYISTDQTKDLGLNLNFNRHIYDDNISYSDYISLGFTYKFSNALQTTGEFGFSKEVNNLQYIGTPDHNGFKYYHLAEMNRKTLSSTLRFDFAITPDFTIQYYGNAYLSLGTFSNFKQIKNPASKDYNKLYEVLGGDKLIFDMNANLYSAKLFDEAGNLSTIYSFGNPDFNYRELRSNLVFRWEFQPGSIVYFVWTHTRTSYEPTTNVSLGNNWTKLWDLNSQNILLAKFQYWFSI